LEEREKEYELARARIFNDNKVEEFIEVNDTIKIPDINSVKEDDDEYNDEVFLLNSNVGNDFPIPSYNDWNYQFMHES
jgi:hypothetical protein